jgi:quercetin dioxygenase-like cupin family protein
MTTASLTAFQYDTSHIDWVEFLTPGTFYKILHVDEANKHADMLVKFEPNSECMYHRHAATTTTLVLQGELRVREQTPQGEVIKVKPAGSYSIGGEGEVHIEGSGDQEAIIFFSMRTNTDVIYEFLNPDLTLKRAVTVADFARDLRTKWPVEAAA